MPCNNLPGEGDPEVCAVGGGGLLLPLGGDAEQQWPNGLRAALYLMGLLWCFMGVAIIADVFMSSIEKVTSRKVLVHDKALGKRRTATVWNPTVANLTLMALGSSAPEILLNVIGIFPTFQSGALGPSTIVGSAAFNLLCISAVCVVSIPNGEVRYIKDLGVYSCTAFFSVFAYLWLLVILLGPSPNIIETWEGVVTFALFWVLVILAFMADKGMLPGTSKPPPTFTVQPESSKEELSTMEMQVRQKYGQTTNLSPEQVSLLMEYDFYAPHSRAKHRVNATRFLSGGRKILAAKSSYELGAELAKELLSAAPDSNKPNSTAETGMAVAQFEALNYNVLESVGSVKIKVRCCGALSGEIQVAYATRDGSAKECEDYEHVDGVLTFRPGKLEEDIEVKIVESKGATEDTEEFYVDLLTGPIGERKTVTVVIIDEDRPGEFHFEHEQMEVKGKDVDEKLTVTVKRARGSSGVVSCKYTTEEGSAKEGADFEKVEGTLVFQSGQQSASFDVVIKANYHYEGTEIFRVVLTDPEGASFDATTDGGSDSCILSVVILADETRKNGIDKLSGMVRLNWDSMHMGNASYKEQIVSSVFCGGSLSAQKESSWPEFGAHIVAMPWKVLFSVVPPTEYAGGWLCFSVALLMIGFVTVIIGDMAELLGCCLGISPATTAITLVALGTSLPDTFASRTAAQMDPYADNSIGNITGSNSVNVFLGLGLPWMIAAIYWEFFASCEAGDTWSLAYPEEALLYPTGKFVVKAGSLTVSVMSFSATALVCMAALFIRRKVFGGELGGPKVSASLTAVFFVSLWCVYIVVSIIFED